MIRILLGWMALLTLLVTAPLRAEPDLLPLEQAFRLSARVVDAGTVEVRFDIADGYYLYRNKLSFAAGQAALGAPAGGPYRRVRGGRSSSGSRRRSMPPHDDHGMGSASSSPISPSWRATAAWQWLQPSATPSAPCA